MWCCSRMESPRASHSRTETLPEPNASSAPMSVGIENRPSRSCVTSPTVPERPDSRLRARPLGENESCSAAASTLVRVSARTCARPFRALDAVAIDTPARRATSDSVVVLRP